MDISSQLRASITSQSLPPPSQTLITSLTTRSPPPSLPSLVATAKARLLAADLTSSTLLDSSQLSSFPPAFSSPHFKEAKIQRDTHVQILDIENLSLSRWEQIEELEAVERGETTRGREVIRVTEEESESGNGTQRSAGASVPGTTNQAGRNATHRLVLQDCKGMRLYAMELKRMEGVGIGKTSIGCKMLLRAGTVVSRATILLAPQNCVLLGGKIDAWHEAWVTGRMDRLKEAAGAGIEGQR